MLSVYLFGRQQSNMNKENITLQVRTTLLRVLPEMPTGRKTPTQTQTLSPKSYLID